VCYVVKQKRRQNAAEDYWLSERYCRKSKEIWEIAGRLEANGWWCQQTVGRA